MMINESHLPPALTEIVLDEPFLEQRSPSTMITTTTFSNIQACQNCQSIDTQLLISESAVCLLCNKCNFVSNPCIKSIVTHPAMSRLTSVSTPAELE